MLPAVLLLLLLAGRSLGALPAVEAMISSSAWSLLLVVTAAGEAAAVLAVLGTATGVVLNAADASMAESAGYAVPVMYPVIALTL